MKKKSARDKAREYILSLLNGNTQPYRLPPIEELCRATGLSVVPVSKALSQLKREKCIHSRYRLGTWSGPRPTTKLSSGGTDWMRIAEKLNQDINAGTWEFGGRLPLTKELCERYGACFQTVKKALEQLTGDRILEHRARGYRIVQRKVAGSRKELVLITRDLYNRTPQEMNERDRIILQALEQSSLHAGLNLSIRAFGFGDNGLAPSPRYKDSPLDFRSMKAAFGIIIRTAGLTSMDLHAYVSQLNSLRIPLVLLDETQLPHAFHVSVPRIEVGLSGVAGHELGLLLNECGANHASYISINHSQPWSEARLAALRRAFCGRVSVQVKSGTESATDSDTEWVVREFNEMMNRMRKSGHCSERFIRAVSSIRGEVRKQATRDHREDRALPLLRRAAHSGADAWVIADTDTAMKAQAFLSHTPAAKRPLLVCLDDAPELQLQGITGYNHNIEALCRQAVELCVRPAKGPLRPREYGFAVPRLTTRA